MKSKILYVPLISLLALSLAGCSIPIGTVQESASASAFSNVSEVPVTDLGETSTGDEVQQNNVKELTVKISSLLSDKGFSEDAQKYLDTGVFNSDYQDKYNLLNEFVEEDEAFIREYKTFLEESQEADTVFNSEDSKLLAKLMIVTQTYQLGYLINLDNGSFGIDVSALKSKDGGMVLDRSGAVYVQNRDGVIYYIPSAVGLTSFNADGTKLTVNTILSDKSKYDKSYGNYLEANVINDDVQAWIVENADKVEEETSLSTFTEDIFAKSNVAQGTSLSIDGTPKYYTVTMVSEDGSMVSIDSDGEIVTEERNGDPLNLEFTKLSQAWETYESIFIFNKTNKNLSLDEVVKLAGNAESPKGSKWSVEKLDNGEEYVKVVIDATEYKLYDITSVVG